MLRTARHILGRSLTTVLALSALAAGTLALPSPVYAEARTSDIVLGKTAEERGIDASELPDLVCPHAILMTQDGTVYFERDADAPIRIASTTKVMTALLALENCELTDIVTVDHAAATVGESNVKLQEGDTLTMEEALTGLMVHSGNDAAMVIATTVGARIDPSSSNPFQTFVDAMNKRAEELGCTDTLFENPHGLDFNGWEGDLHSTARDIVTIYATAMKNDDFRRLSNSDRTDMHVTSADGTERTVELTVRNEIRGQQGNIGGKTGSTYEAKRCFVGAFSREKGGEVYVAVFGDETSEERFGDTFALANWYYDHLAEVPLAHTEKTYGKVPIVGEAVCLNWTDKTVRVTSDDPEASATVFSLAGPLEQNVELKDFAGAVKRGADAGTLTLTQGDDTLGELKLVTAESVGGTTPLEWVMVQFDRLVRIFTGEGAHADSVVYCEAPDPLACDNWNVEE